MGTLPSPEEQQDFEDLMKEKASDRLYRLENGLALNLEEVAVGIRNMVPVKLLSSTYFVYGNKSRAKHLLH